MIEENNGILDNGLNSGGIMTQLPYATGVLVLGIISIPSCFCYGIGFICAIIALVLAKKGKGAYKLNPSKYTPSSYNNLKSGKVCAIIGLILNVPFFLITIIALIIGAGLNPEEIQEFLNNLK